MKKITIVSQTPELTIGIVKGAQEKIYAVVHNTAGYALANYREYADAKAFVNWLMLNYSREMLLILCIDILEHMNGKPPNESIVYFDAVRRSFASFVEHYR